MKIHQLKNNQNNKSKKRLGRGISAGGGMTAGRGTKGQKSRSGHNIPRKFEGGQTPLIMRLHKLPGFKSHRAKAEVITLDEVSKSFADGETVSMQSLEEKGIIKKGQRAKILNSGKLTVKIKIASDIKVSKSARESIDAINPKFEISFESEPKSSSLRVEDRNSKPASPAGRQTGSNPNV